MYDIDSIRQDFPILRQKINREPLCYLDNGASTQKPHQVLDRITAFYSSEYSNVHRGVHQLSRIATRLNEQAREAAAGFINAGSSDEIVFTTGTTGSINLVAYSFGEKFIRENDEIITTVQEHHANIVPWQRLCQRSNAVLKAIPLDEEGNLRVEAVKELIVPETRLISLAHVSNVLGVLNPVEEIIEIAHRHDIPVMIDAAQSIQHLPVDVQELDCDFLVFSGHKMYGPTGIGVLYAKRKWLETLPPFNTGGGMIESVSFDRTVYEKPPFKFEAGTGHIAGAIGLAAAIEYINSIGIEEIKEHEAGLLRHLENKLSDLEDVTIYAAREEKHGGLSFNLKGIHHYDAGMILDGYGVAVRTGAHCAEPLMEHLGITGTVRASVALYNNTDDMDRLAEGVKEAQNMMKVQP